MSLARAAEPASAAHVRRAKRVLADASAESKTGCSAVRDLHANPGITLMATILAIIEAIMNEISRYIPITKAKNDLLELIRQVEKVDESVAVTKNAVPAAVILSMEKYPLARNARDFERRRYREVPEKLYTSSP